MEAVKKLRTLANKIDWYVYDNGGIQYDLRKIADEMESENAKLRELLRDYDRALASTNALCDRDFAPFNDATLLVLRSRMYDLGIEVSDD